MGSSDVKRYITTARQNVLIWLSSRRTAATFASSAAIISVFTIAIGNYFSHLTNQRIISQQTSKLLVNQGLLVAEVENAHGDLKFVNSTLFKDKHPNTITPFEIYQQHEDYLKNFIDSQRSYLSLAWRESPISRTGQLLRREETNTQTGQNSRDQDQSRLTIFQPVHADASHQQATGLELSLSIAKILNPPSSELPYKNHAAF